MFAGDKTGIIRLFFKHCEQADHQPVMLQHLEKVKAIEVLHCTTGRFKHFWMSVRGKII